MSGHVVVDEVFVASSRCFVSCVCVPGAYVPEERVGLFAGAYDRVHGVSGFGVCEQALVGPRIVEGVEQQFYSSAADVDSEVLLGDVFDIVRLVDDDVFVFGDQREALLFEDKVAEHECMVCDNDVGAIEPSAGVSVEAVSEVGTSSGRAVTVLTVDGVPCPCVGKERQVGERAVERLCGPFVYCDELGIESVVKKSPLPHGKV